MASTVASLDDRCVCTVSSVEDDGSEYDCGWVADAARCFGGTNSSVGSAIQSRVYGMEDGLEERRKAGVRARA
jgi:hypothetical protein